MERDGYGLWIGETAGFMGAASVPFGPSMGAELDRNAWVMGSDTSRAGPDLGAGKGETRPAIGLSETPDTVVFRPWTSRLNVVHGLGDARG